MEVHKIPPTTIIITYEEEGENIKKIIPRNLRFILKHREKYLEKLKKRKGNCEEIDFDSFHKESLFGLDILKLISADDKILEKRNPIKMIYQFKNEQNSLNVIKMHDSFAIEKNKENIFSFVIKRKFPITEYSYHSIMTFQTLNDGLRFSSKIHHRNSDVIIRYYDIFHHGFTRIMDFRKIPSRRTGKSMVKIIFEKKIIQKSVASMIDEEGFVLIEQVHEFTKKEENYLPFTHTKTSNETTTNDIGYNSDEEYDFEKSLQRKKKELEEEVLLPGSLDKQHHFFTKYIDFEKLYKKHFLWISFEDIGVANWEKQYLGIKRLLVGRKKRLKKLVRAGIPEIKKRDIWMTLTGGDKLFENEGLYDRLFQRVFKYYKNTNVNTGGNGNGNMGNNTNGNESDNDDIDSDDDGNESDNDKEKLRRSDVDPRMFPEFGGKLDINDPNGSFLNKKGIAAYKRILCILSEEFSSLEYCPFIPYVIHLLLFYLSEEETYCCLHSMVSISLSLSSNLKREQNWYFRTTKIQNALFIETFISLVKQKLPKIANHFLLINYNLTKLASIWFEMFFCSFLPLSIIIRIFDAFLNEGSKILYRAGLTILKLFESSILSCKDSNYMNIMISKKSFSITNDDMFFKFFYNLGLKRRTIKRFDEKHREGFDFNKLSTKRINNFIKPSIANDSQSEIIEGMKQWEAIYSWVPGEIKLKIAKKIFSSMNDGYSLTRLLKSARKTEPNLILIEAYPLTDIDDLRFIKNKTKRGKLIKKTKDKRISGHQLVSKLKKEKEKSKLSTKEKFLHSQDSPKNCIFGAFSTGELVHTFGKFTGDSDSFLFSLYPIEQPFFSTQKNHHFLYVDGTKRIVFGSGGDGAGLTIDSDIQFGSSYQCDTFDNEPLALDNINFVILKIEVYKFED